MSRLSAAPGVVEAAQGRQRRMLTAMAERDAGALAALLAEGPRYVFVPGVHYRLLVLASPPIPATDLSDPIQAALLIDYLTTAEAAAPIEVTALYRGRLPQPPGYPHVFLARDGRAAVIADIDVLAYEAAES